MDEPAYERWFGPSMLDFQDLSHEGTRTWRSFGQAFAIHVNDITSNHYLTHEAEDDLHPFSSLDHVVLDSQSDEDIDLRIVPYKNTFDVNVGSFDIEALRAEMPESREKIGTLGDHDVYSWPVNLGFEGVTREGVAASTETIVSSIGFDDDHLIENLGTILSLGTNDSDRFVDTHDATDRFFERLGDGHWTVLKQFGETPQFGIRMRFDGDVTRRKTVGMYESETAASESDWADPETVEQYRTTPGDGRPSGTHGNFAHYRNFDHTVDGRFVVFSGTLDTDAVARNDTFFP